MDTPPQRKQLLFRVRVYEGDPLGSLAEGTLKVLAEPNCIALENGEFSYATEGVMPLWDDEHVKFVPVGLTIKGEPETVKDGKVRIDIMLSNSVVVRKGERIEFQTESMRTSIFLRPGEVVKLRYCKGSADRQGWIELSMFILS
jgi:hypothetical protein